MEDEALFGGQDVVCYVVVGSCVSKVVIAMMNGGVL